MDLAHEVCQFCQKVEFKYTCPKCSALYCSKICFRKPGHKKCTSLFHNIFRQSSSYSQMEHNEVMMRYMILRKMLEVRNGSKKERTKSESSNESERSFWTGDVGNIGDDGFYSHIGDDSFDICEDSNDDCYDSNINNLNDGGDDIDELDDGNDDVDDDDDSNSDNFDDNDDGDDADGVDDEDDSNSDSDNSNDNDDGDDVDADDADDDDDDNDDDCNNDVDKCNDNDDDDDFKDDSTNDDNEDDDDDDDGDDDDNIDDDYDDYDGDDVDDIGDFDNLCYYIVSDDILELARQFCYSLRARILERRSKVLKARFDLYNIPY